MAPDPDSVEAAARGDDPVGLSAGSADDARSAADTRADPTAPDAGIGETSSRRAEPDSAGGPPEAGPRGDSIHADAGAATSSVAPVEVELDFDPPADLYKLGQSEAEGGHLEEAVAAFHAYGEAEPWMLDVAALAEGQSLFELGRHEEAATAFETVLRTTPDPGTRFLGALRLGNARLRTGPADAARDAYNAALDASRSEHERAQALAGLIAVEDAEGRPAAVAALRQRVVLEAPGSAAAPTSLARLESAGIDVSPVGAARVLIEAGRAAEAATLLRAALERPESAGHPEWTLEAARAEQAAGDTRAALELARDAAGSASPVAGDAAWLAAELLANTDPSAGAQAFADFAADRPADPRVVDAWVRRAVLLDRLAPDDPAPWIDVARAVPGTQAGRDAAFRVGFEAWRRGDLAEAGTWWSELAENVSADDAARATFWLARMRHDAGDAGQAARLWTAAAGLTPEGYYGIQARRRLATPETAGAGGSGVSEVSTAEPSAAGRTTGEEVRAWLGSDPAAWEGALSASDASTAIKRARSWRALGDDAAARATLRRATGDLTDRPLELAALATSVAALDLPDAGARTAAAALEAGPSARQPVSLLRLRYPTPYRSIVLAEAREAGLPPALLYGLMRQESLFDATARSSVGAIGLSQVMPDTGRWLAARLGVPDFTPDDLLDPALAIRFGAQYLRMQLEALDGIEGAALAAYNGGPGNARRWLEDAGGDPEVLPEIIDYAETRRFVRRVTEQRARYEALYPEMSAQN